MILAEESLFQLFYSKSNIIQRILHELIKANILLAYNLYEF